MTKPDPLRFWTLRLAVALAVILGLSAAGARAQVAVPSDLEARIDAYVLPYVRTNNFSGAILVGRAGKALLRKGYGLANVELGVPNSAETIFHVASISKSFTAAAIVLLEQRGKLNTADPLSQHIPGYPNGERITVHQLLVHASGIPNVNNFPDYDEWSLFPHGLEEIIGWFRDKPLEFEPGGRYSYSNSNYNLLALIIEKVSGRPYGEFMRSEIFAPLGMNDTAHDGDPAAIIPRRAYGYMPRAGRDLETAPPLVWSIKTGNGSIYTTVDDLHKWDRALYGDQLLSRESRLKIFTDHNQGAGYGWFIRRGKKRQVAMSGRAPGFAANLDRFLDDEVCIAMASNLYSSITHTMAGDLAAIVFGEKREPLIPADPVRIDPATMDGYAGRYQFGKDFSFNPGMVGEVKRLGDWLAIISGEGGQPSYLIPLGQNRFLDRLYGGILTFGKDAQGRINHVIWNFGTDYRAQRVR